MKVQVLFAASVHVAVAFVPTAKQVTLRLSSDEDEVLDLANATPAMATKPNKVEIESMSASECIQCTEIENCLARLLACVCAGR